VWQQCEDLGIKGFRHMDAKQLETLLYFLSGWPMLFAKWRSQSGKCSWEDDMAKEFMADNPDMHELKLLWH
jgi:hypothetical protein